MERKGKEREGSVGEGREGKRKFKILPNFFLFIDSY
jgi:hypothetical protein